MSKIKMKCPNCKVEGYAWENDLYAGRCLLCPKCHKPVVLAALKINPNKTVAVQAPHEAMADEKVTPVNVSKFIKPQIEKVGLWKYIVESVLGENTHA